MAAINSTMFDTPNRGNQSSNINQLTPDWVNIAYQESDSLLAGNNSIWANRSLTKNLVIQSAKIYANQSPKFTGNQSGEYFSGYKSADILRYSNLSHSKDGKFTPFAKGDFSHLSKEENYPHWQGLIGVTTQGRIEFFESIKGKIIEFCQSIKKGSQPATLGDVDIEYRASENINISLLLWYGKYQPLSSIPRDCSSFLIMRLIQADTDASPSCSNAVFIPNSSDGSTRKAICLFPLPDILMVDTWFTPDYIIIESQVYDKCIPKTMPRSASTLTGHLTTNDNTSIEVTMSKHNTPVTGRNSHTQNIVFIWRFAECQQNKTTYHLVIAHTENKATTKDTFAQIEFLVSIKKGSFVKCAIHHLRLWVIVGYSERALAKSSVRIGVLNNILATHDAPSVFFCVHAYAHLLNAVLYRAYSMVAAVEQPKGWLVSLMSSYANSAVVTTPEIGVSSGDSLQNIKEIIVMMATPTQTQFKFLFLSIKRSDTTAKPCRIAVTAPNENSARLMLVRDYMLIFAGRLPAIGGKHHA